MRTKLILLLGVCLLVSACKKRQYPDDKVRANEEEIYFNGSVDGQPFSLKIGTDDYYCFSSYTQNTDDIYVFQSELKKFNCNPCPSSLWLALSDYMPRSAGATIPPDSVIPTGTRNFIPALSKLYSVKFSSSSNKEIVSSRWELANGTSVIDSFAIFHFGQLGAQTISLTVKTKGNCESKVVNKIFLDNMNGVFACGIKVTSIQNNHSEFAPSIIGGQAPFSYTWYFGDGKTSTQSAPAHDYQWSGSYPVKLIVRDAQDRV